MSVYFDVRYLFHDTVVTGGDTASWQGVAQHMLDELLPKGRLTGWDMGNFCGYPNFTFYFIPPFLLATLPAFFFNVPLTVSLKLAIMSGVFLLPICTYLGLRKMRYSFPLPIIGACSSLLLLFNESYTMFGGNALSTFAGEFSYMFAFALFAYFIGSLYDGVTADTGWIKNGLLLGLIGLSHLFVFMPAGILIIHYFFTTKNIRYLLKVTCVGVGLMAFWLMPLLAYKTTYSTPFYMIWNEYLATPYLFIGLGLICLFVGPRIAFGSLPTNNSGKMPWLSRYNGTILIAVAGTLAAINLTGYYLLYGDKFLATGLFSPILGNVPISFEAARTVQLCLFPFSAFLAVVVAGLGFIAKKKPGSWSRYAFDVGASFFYIGALLVFIALHSALDQTTGFRKILLSPKVLLASFVVWSLTTGWFFFFSKCFKKTTTEYFAGAANDRLAMFLSLIIGCIVLYFSAHFLEIPDIRFLPPVFFVLILIIFVETLGPYLSERSGIIKSTSAGLLLAASLIWVSFTATEADKWFRYNNRGYENTPGYADFSAVNSFLRNSYTTDFPDPLNAPRVAYEKSSSYNIYGGDRVFESISYFSGRQTMEGIHYASSVASKFIAFLQTEYSLETMAPAANIFSKINPAALPIHFDLYNISQLILRSETAKKAVSASPFFEKEVDIGPLSIFRYTACREQYVEVPELRPVLYTGRNWRADFYEWFRRPELNGILLVPESYVKDPDDRAVFQGQADSLDDLQPYLSETLRFHDAEIKTELDHLKIRFTTNMVGMPHLVKVSYFPNWQVKGANGVYPVSPHLMIIVPREREVVLTYGFSFWEKLGAAVTIGTVLVLLLIGFRNFPFVNFKIYGADQSRWFFSALENFLLKVRPLTLLLVLFVAVGTSLGGSIYRNRPVSLFVQGNRLYSEGMYLLNNNRKEMAKKYFHRAITVMGPNIWHRNSIDQIDIINSILLSATCFENLSDIEKAKELYTIIVKEYSYSRYVGEAHVRIARLNRETYYRLRNDLYKTPENDESIQAVDLLNSSWENLLAALNNYGMAINMAPFTSWSGQAREEARQLIEEMKSGSPLPPTARFNYDMDYQKLISAWEVKLAETDGLDKKE